MSLMQSVLANIETMGYVARSRKVLERWDTWHDHRSSKPSASQRLTVPGALSSVAATSLTR